MKAKAIESWQKRKIYAIANALGYTAKTEETDILHLIMEDMTGKQSVTKLTYDDANKLIDYLVRQQTSLDKSDNVSKGQQKKIWALMYELKDCDLAVNPAPIGERLAGIITRQFGVRSTPIRLFTYLDYVDGEKLIEILKHYIDNAERKRMS